MSKKYVSWRRVSTFKQNRSGLGLEAQKEIIRYFIERDNGVWLADYEECYTGTELSGCSELKKAIAHTKQLDAVLIIAKTDRFRNTAEALKIYEEMGDGHIMFCDLPSSDKFSLTLFFALAEREALITSIRTKQALAVKKAQGALLGGANPKYKEARRKKTWETKEKEDMKKGITKTRRYLESRDVQAFIKILQRCFPEATQGELAEWDWKAVNTKRGNRERVLRMMADWQSMDFEGKLFIGWDFATDMDGVDAQVKLASFIRSLKRSALASERHKAIV